MEPLERPTNRVTFRRGRVQHLTRLMGRARALEVMLSADDYDAEMALARMLGGLADSPAR